MDLLFMIFQGLSTKFLKNQKKKNQSLKKENLPIYFQDTYLSQPNKTVWVLPKKKREEEKENTRQKYKKWMLIVKKKWQKENMLK